MVGDQFQINNIMLMSNAATIIAGGYKPKMVSVNIAHGPIGRILRFLLINLLRKRSPENVLCNIEFNQRMV